MKVSPLQIFIADDDLEDLELLEEAILELEPDSSIDKATGGKHALEYLNNYTENSIPDLIILDYNMPELTGADILGVINQQSRFIKIPKIILSTSNSSLHIKECLSKGATQYFTKPATKEQLDDITREMLALIPNYKSSAGK